MRSEVVPNEPELWFERQRLGKSQYVALIVIALLLVLLFGGLGFAAHLLWIVALILLILWLTGFAVGRGERAGARGWYRW